MTDQHSENGTKAAVEQIGGSYDKAARPFFRRFHPLATPIFAALLFAGTRTFWEIPYLTMLVETIVLPPGPDLPEAGKYVAVFKDVCALAMCVIYILVLDKELFGAVSRFSTGAQLFFAILVAAAAVAVTFTFVFDRIVGVNTTIALSEWVIDQLRLRPTTFRTAAFFVGGEIAIILVCWGLSALFKTYRSMPVTLFTLLSALLYSLFMQVTVPLPTKRTSFISSNELSASDCSTRS